MKLLEGKNALILGLANERSIAWGIAKQLKNAGANIAFNYLGEALKKRVIPLAQEIGADFTFDLDVTNESQMNSLPQTVKNNWDQVDILVHSLAFADKEELKKPFVETSKNGFLKAIHISAYSLVEVTQKLQYLMPADSSIITLTYHGSTQVIPGYNLMGVAKATLEASVRYLSNDLGPQGVRVNAISAGPIKTLAASGVPGLREKLSHAAEKSPLKRNVTQDEVGKTALYLASDLSSGVTGEIIYVDSGLSLIGD